MNSSAVTRISLFRRRILYWILLALVLMPHCQAEQTDTADIQDLIRYNFFLSGFSGSCAVVTYLSPGNYSADVRPLPPALCSRSALFGATYAESVQRAGPILQKSLELLNLLDGTGSACPLSRAALASYIQNPAAAPAGGGWFTETDYNNYGLFYLPEPLKDFATSTVLTNISNGGVSAENWLSARITGFSDERLMFSLVLMNTVISAQGEAGCVSDNLTAAAALYPGFVWTNFQDPNLTPQRQILSFNCSYGRNATTTCLYDLPEYID